MRHALLLLLAFSTASSADDRTTLRKAAEQLERDAKQTKDLAKYTACGTAYLDIHNKFPGPESDETLYNAGVCFHEGRSLGAALQAFELIKRDFATSKIAPRALARSGMIYAGILQLDKAAERLEEYALKYAGEKDAYAALSDATLYRRVLGDHKRAIANTQFYVRTFGMKKPVDALQAMLNLTPVFDGDRVKQLAHLKTVLRMHRLDDEQKAVVLLKMGDLLSATSCPVPLQEGLCIKLERQRAKGCTKDAVRTVVVKRSAAYKDALGAYAGAVKQFERVRSAHAGYAHAKLALVDAELERLMQRKPPTSKQLDAWLAETTAQAKPIHDRYEALVDATPVAAGRLGQTVEAVWRMVRLVETKDCTAVDDIAAPLAQRAGEAFAVCLDKAAQLGVHDAHARMCLREGQLVDPAHVLARDLHPDPSGIAVSILPDKIGDADYRAGRKSAAIKAWEAALANNGKLLAPRINLAIARYDELQALPANAPTRKQLVADITLHAQTALGIEQHPAPFVLLAALALEDKQREDFAKFLLDEARRRDDKYAPAYVGLGVLAGRRDQWQAAVAHLERAAELDPASEAVRLALVLAELRVGRFAAAATRLATFKRATYDIELARGVAARGLGKHADAKAAYERAVKLDPTRTEAAQNLATHKP